MVIVLIRRCVRPDKEKEFLDRYSKEKPQSSDFLGETLTKVEDSASLPESMRSLPIMGTNCITYLNIASWKSAEAFQQHFDPATMHDPAIEISDRLRVVLEVSSPT
jgi:hypothetical protein